MLSDVWEWAGVFRKTQSSIGVKPYLISGALESLCSEVQYWCSEACELMLVEQAARVHHQLVLIHPFLNGNGRFSRLVEEESGHQPLNIALRHGLSEVALLLITNGANFKQKDHSGLNGFEWALTKEFYDLAHEMVRRGYPYTPRQPNPQLKVPDRNLYRFDSSYF